MFLFYLVFAMSLCVCLYVLAQTRNIFKIYVYDEVTEDMFDTKVRKGQRSGIDTIMHHT